jgi:hypothetical protein
MSMDYLDQNLTVLQNKHNTHEEEKIALRNDKAPSIHFTVNKQRISLFGLYEVLLLCAFYTIKLVKCYVKRLWSSYNEIVYDNYESKKLYNEVSSM